MARFLVLVGLLAVLAAPGNGLSLRRTSSFRALSRFAGRLRSPAPGVSRVIDMMETLAKEIDAQQAADEDKSEAFSKWCEDKEAVTSQSIQTLTTRIGELEASLAQLYAQKQTLEADVRRLSDEIGTTQGQINVATEKRNEENQAYVAEQADFDASIAACGRAAGLMASHYGEPAKEAEKPSWMSFAEVAHTISKTLLRSKHEVDPGMLALIQQPQSFERYQASSGEAGNIVDELKALGETFIGDKKSAIEDEKRLSDLFNELMTEKTTLLNNLIAERDSQQSILNGVNRDIAEQESAKSNAESGLEYEQEYLAHTRKMCSDTHALFAMRSGDRKAEGVAVAEAMKVLSGPAGNPEEAPALVQLRMRQSLAGRSHACVGCQKAATLLAEASKTLHSQTLAAASSLMSHDEAVQDLVGELENLVLRIDQDMKMQKQHKEWCETELSAAASKVEHHQGLVEELAQKSADNTEVIAEKQGDIADTNVAIQKADQNFQETTTIREQEREDLDVEHHNYVDAIAALNEAQGILAKFYCSKDSRGSALCREGSAAALMQEAERESTSGSSHIAPGAFEGVYESKGGKGVIEMLQTVRKEFSAGKADLETAMKQVRADYKVTRGSYEAMRRALVQQRNRLTVELQTAQGNQEQYTEDSAANTKVVASTQAYAGQLSSSSCNALMNDFEERVKTREAEKDALQGATKVLEEHA